MQKNRFLRNSEGFSMVEVMVMSLVFGILMIGFHGIMKNVKIADSLDKSMTTAITEGHKVGYFVTKELESASRNSAGNLLRNGQFENSSVSISSWNVVGAVGAPLPSINGPIRNNLATPTHSGVTTIQVVLANAGDSIALESDPFTPVPTACTLTYWVYLVPTTANNIPPTTYNFTMNMQIRNSASALVYNSATGETDAFNRFNNATFPPPTQNNPWNWNYDVSPLQAGKWFCGHFDVPSINPSGPNSQCRMRLIFTRNAGGGNCSNIIVDDVALTPNKASLINDNDPASVNTNEYIFEKPVLQGSGAVVNPVYVWARHRFRAESLVTQGQRNNHLFLDTFSSDQWTQTALIADHLTRFELVQTYGGSGVPSGAQTTPGVKNCPIQVWYDSTDEKLNRGIVTKTVPDEEDEEKYVTIGVEDPNGGKETMAIMKSVLPNMP